MTPGMLVRARIVAFKKPYRRPGKNTSSFEWDHYLANEFTRMYYSPF